MKSHLVLVDRDELLIELRQVFDAQTAETLLSVLDKVAAQVYAAGVTREDFSELKAIVADLAEAQRQSEARLSGVETRLSRLEESVAALVEAQKKIELVLLRMDERLSRLEDRVDRLEVKVDRLEVKVAKLDGRTLELTYREKADAYLSRLLRRPEVMVKSHLWELLESHLSEDELSDLVLTDLIVRGKPRRRTDIGELWLTIEVSAVVDGKDVERACRRAELLRRAGYKVIPVVAGEEATLGAEAEARSQGAMMLQDERSLLWDEAFAKWTV
jgi:predicted nuclease with TOPRIM domain